ncbi:MAG: family 16 glycosylhydrolase [Bacteroidota bacterium]|nr:family 16 glycosylhydrolase [Bacteroidota bacterium]
MISKKIFLLFGLVLAVNGLAGQSWRLVWADEFDGDTLNTNKWSYMIGDGTEYGIPGWGNNELQYYQEENVSVGDGVMTITAKRENVETSQFTSGRIRTIDMGDWTYGRFEFRAKMPVGKGLWAAIWMLPTDENYGGWAASGEIDIMEYLGDDTTKVYGTIHYGGQWPENEHRGTDYVTDDTAFHKAFHTFALEWEEGKLRWYVDGELFQNLGTGMWYSSAADFPAPFNRRFHLLINLAVGGNWPGDPDANTHFPQRLVVDYVRVYQDGVSGLNEESAELELGQNHPNPFDDLSEISFSLISEEEVLLEVYDSTGRKVRTLADKSFGPGTHKVAVEARDLEPGIYSYRLQTGSSSSVKQMLIL